MLLFLALVSLTVSLKCVPSCQGCTYDDFLLDYPRTFKSAEQKQQKEKTFNENCKEIRDNNADFQAGKVTYKKTVNQFTDFTFEQFAGHRGLKPTSLGNLQGVKVGSSSDIRVGIAPASLDYKSTGVVPPQIYDQGTCGSCWAFASTAMYQSLLAFYNLTYTSISQQDILECCKYYAPDARVSDCNGGYIYDSLIILSKVGGLPRSTFPYLAANYGDNSGNPTTPNICTQSNRIKIGDGTILFYSNGLTDNQIKQLLVDNGPLMIGIYADSGFMSYSSGIYSGCPSFSRLLINHAVLLYGYDASGNWLIKNQWGTVWGQSGYMRLSSSNNCGFNYQVGALAFNSGINPNPSVSVSNIEQHFTSTYSGTSSTTALGWAHLLLTNLVLFALILIL